MSLPMVRLAAARSADQRHAAARRQRRARSSRSAAARAGCSRSVTSLQRQMAGGEVSIGARRCLPAKRQSRPVVHARRRGARGRPMACWILLAVATSWSTGVEKLISRLWKATSVPMVSVPSTTCRAPTPRTAAARQARQQRRHEVASLLRRRPACCSALSARGMVAGPLGEEIALRARSPSGSRSICRPTIGDGVELAAPRSASCSARRPARAARFGAPRTLMATPASAISASGDVVEQHDDAEHQPR